jgi:hypothetical protein
MIGMAVVMVLVQKVEWSVDVMDGEECRDQERAQKTLLPREQGPAGSCSAFLDPGHRS